MKAYADLQKSEVREVTDSLGGTGLSGVPDSLEVTEVTDTSKVTNVPEVAKPVKISESSKAFKVTEPSDSSKVTESIEVLDSMTVTALTEASDSTEVADSTEIACPFNLSEFSEPLYLGFFRDNTLLHPEVPYRSMGQHAELRPYQLWRDDLITGILLLCLLMLILTINRTRQQLAQQTRDFFFPSRERPKQFAVGSKIEGLSRLFNVFLLSMMGSLFMFGYAQYEQQIFLGQTPPYWLFGIYMGCFLSFFAVKRILNRFINWIFFPKSQQKMWNESYAYLFFIESILFFPLLLTSVYFHLPYEKLAWTFLFILLLIKILLAFKTYKIFFPKSYCVFHLFAYLCALEIMPLLALWKSLALVTENLIVKY